MKNQQSIFEGVYDAVADFSHDELGQLWRAYMGCIRGEEVKLTGKVGTALAFMLRDYRAAKEKREQLAQKRRECGMKGGRPRQIDECEEVTLSERQMVSEESKEKQKKQMVSEESKEKQTVSEERNKEKFPPYPPIKKQSKEFEEKDSKESQKNDEAERRREEELSPMYRNFRQWMAANTPTLYKGIGRKLTEAEFAKIRHVIDCETLGRYAMQLENNRDYLRKYRNMYLTLVNWIKRDGL